MMYKNCVVNLNKNANITLSIYVFVQFLLTFACGHWTKVVWPGRVWWWLVRRRGTCPWEWCGVLPLVCTLRPLTLDPHPLGWPARYTCLPSLGETRVLTTAQPITSSAKTTWSSTLLSEVKTAASIYSLLVHIICHCRGSFKPIC